MTSAATHAATVAYFGAHGFFGLPERDVFFFQQGELASVSLLGQVLLATPTSVRAYPAAWEPQRAGG
jgi:UDP-N-acetylglucosamine/UDP-N-acetylgalactosamine diphosphorylase